MSAERQLHVAVIGLGFGKEFVPIYLHHPAVAAVTICDANASLVDEVAERFGIERKTTRFADILAADDIDAVHLVTGIPQHAEHSVAVLESDKHCACTVPMATTLADLERIVAAQRVSGKQYMMMETAVYTRQFLYVRELLAQGAFGQLQFLRGAHYQDMENWPSYWMGLPPMHYATHAVSPLLAAAATRATKVHCFGSGVMRAELQQPYGNPFPFESAIFQLEGTPVAAEVSRSLFQTAREYVESFIIYGEDLTFEWGIENEAPRLYAMEPLHPGRGRPITVNRLEDIPDRQDLLPPEIARFTQRGVYDEANPHRSFQQGGGHHGSHPHLVHEFVSSIAQQRPPWIDAITAANWSAAGICAHLSAMQGGEAVDIPRFN